MLMARHYDDDEIKIKIDNTRQNSKSRLCEERDETVNHIITECRKLVQNSFKNKHDLMGKAIGLGIVQKIKIPTY